MLRAVSVAVILIFRTRVIYFNLFQYVEGERILQAQERISGYLALDYPGI